MAVNKTQMQMKVMTKMKYQIPKFEYYTINLTSITL